MWIIRPPFLHLFAIEFGALQDTALKVEKCQAAGLKVGVSAAVWKLSVTFLRHSHDRSCFNILNHECLDDLTLFFHHIPPIMQVLFCIGELLEERESGKTDEAESERSKHTKLKLR